VTDSRVVIITGAARGIGRHVARTFADDGARLVLADIAPLDTVVREVTQRNAEVLPVTINVRDETAVRSLIDDASARFGRIDILINNAAIVTHFQWGTPRWPKIRDMEKGFWDSVIDTNLGGTFLCTKYVLPIMEGQRSGHIINLSNPGGRGDSLGACAYGVSKTAIGMFTRFVAEEEREFDICVVGMTPGNPIATEEAPEEARQRMATVDYVGRSFVLASQVPMSLSGQQLRTSSDGGVEVVP
jgi:3-oxoacyl-[acyl-carrier protein] reductase